MDCSNSQDFIRVKIAFLLKENPQTVSILEFAQIGWEAILADKRYPPITATAADMGRNFGDWQSRALKSPVAITHHGKPRLILASIDLFDLSEQPPVTPSHQPQLWELRAQFQAVLNQINECFIAFDQQLKIADCNPAAELFIGLARKELTGRDLRELMPQTNLSIAWDFFQRVIKTGQAAEFRLKSVIHSQVRLNLKAFPYDGGGVGVIFTNLVNSEEASILRTRSRAMQAALQPDPALSLIRLNVRGGIEVVDTTFCTMTGFSQEQLSNLLLAEIIHQRDRSALNRTLNALIKDGMTKTVTVCLVPRSESERPIRLNMSLANHEIIPEEIAVMVVDVERR